MKRSKKIKVLSIICAAVLALTACGGNSKAPQTDAAPQKEEENPASAANETEETATDAETEGEEAESTEAEPETAEEEPEEAGNIAIEGQGLASLYADNFPIGVALPAHVFQSMSLYEDVILNNFNIMTCENETKPESLLDKEACQADLENCYENPAVKFDSCAPAIAFAVEHDMKLRIHPLVWHSQTPNWFFTEDYTDNGNLVSREVMLKRMENYIASVLGYFSENYPGLVYAVDVVNEAFDTGDGDENGVRMQKNRWYDTVGDDYYYHAFVFARKYAAEDMKLFYNDYGCMWKVKLMLDHLQKVQDEGLIDGIGMQGHLSTSDLINPKFIMAAKQFCDAGYEVQVTELDIGIEDTSDANLRIQGRKYKSLFRNMKAMQEEGYPVTGITIWGLCDRMSWRTGEHALLLDDEMMPKLAYEGAMLMDSVPDIE